MRSGLLLLLGVLVGCSAAPVEDAASSEGAILQGKAATNADGVVRVIYAGQWSCGGSLVAANWVLTAAHCLDGKDAKDFTVRVGALDLRLPGSSRAVVKLWPHEKYDGETYTNDVALMELAPPTNEDVTASKKLTTLMGCLDTTEIGAGVDLVGYGATNAANENTQSPVLQTVSTTVIDCTPFANTGVKGDIFYRNLDPATALCVGKTTGEANACGGDSGSPLFVRKDSGRVQSGIDSLGVRPCGEANRPTVYTRVAPYLAWIHATSNGAAGQACSP